MVKSSEVLRLAAEYSFEGLEMPLVRSCLSLIPDGQTKLSALGFALEAGMDYCQDPKDKLMVLCMAAAIAEDAGD